MSLRAVGFRLELTPPVDPSIQVVREYVGAKQYGSLLCWAACVESVLKSPPNDRHVMQAELARRYIYQCRTLHYGYNIRHSHCNQAIETDRMTAVWYDVGFENVNFKSEAEMPERLGAFVAEELCERGPIQAWIDQRHGVMIYGYRRYADGKEEVLEMDPQPSHGTYWRSLRPNSRWTGLWSGLRA